MQIVDEQVDQSDPFAWQAPGLFRVAEGVYRLPLPIPIAELGSVNCYLFVDGGEVVLVDPGWADESTRDLISAALKTLGLTDAAVKVAVSTHAHWDHYSASMQFRSGNELPIALGIGEQPSVESWSSTHRLHTAQTKLLVSAGAPGLARVLHEKAPEAYELGIEYELPDLWLKTGDTLRFGARVLEVLETPGHTRGHITLIDRASGVVVTGDHVLPRITPSLGYELSPQDNPLDSYLQSLRMMLDLDDALLLPAHGNITSSVHLRARELLTHHEDRLRQIEEQLVSAPKPAAALAGEMRWTRKQLRLDGLAPTHQMLAILEVRTHLSQLEAAGRAIVDSEAGVEQWAAPEQQ